MIYKKICGLHKNHLSNMGISVIRLSMKPKEVKKKCILLNI